MQKKIPQTSRAILFEEFNPLQEDLATILSSANTDEVGTTDFPVEVERKLSVRSFSEFMEKFAPKIYEIQSNNEIFYTTDAEKARRYNVDVKNQGKSIRENTYYQMLEALYVQKGDSKKANLEFDDKKFLDMLSPEQEVENAKTIRKELNYVVKKYSEAKQNGTDTASYVKKIKNYRRTIAQNYKESIVGLLPLAIADAKSHIEALQRSLPKDTLQEDDIKALPSGKLTFDSDGNIQYLPAVSAEQNLSNEESNKSDKYMLALTSSIKKDFSKAAPIALKDSEFAKQLVVSTYAPLSLADEGAGMNVEQRQERIADYKNQVASYEKIYNNAKQSFINELSKLIEKILGVEVFFDHATAEGSASGELEEPLLVANCQPEKLVSGTTIKSKFEKYIASIGNETTKKCWFALLPAVYTEDMLAEIKDETDNAEDDDAFDDIDDIDNDAADSANNEQKDTKYLNLTAAKQLLTILDKGRILTIFNFKGMEETSFAKFSKRKFEDMQKELADVREAHAVFAYPNFTLMNVRKPTSGNPFTLPGIYIDATYPAAGLLIASQQYSSLKARGFKVDKEMSCVRINLEENGMMSHFATKFNRENSYRWNSELKKDVTSEMFGFAFCGDDYWENNQPIEHTYILCARTMAKAKNGKYKPIYYVLMEDYIAAYIAVIGRKYSVINETLIKKDVNDWTKNAKRRDEVNQMLHVDETIQWNDDRNKIVICLNEGDEILQDIDITTEENQSTDKR